MSNVFGFWPRTHYCFCDVSNFVNAKITEEFCQFLVILN